MYLRPVFEESAFCDKVSIANIGLALTIRGWILCFHPLENPYAFDEPFNHNIR